MTEQIERCDRMQIREIDMTIRLPKGIKDNLRFLSVEVDSQVADLQNFFSIPTTAMARRILDRSGYAYNLKTRIHTSCVNRLATGKTDNTQKLTLRGVEMVATDLERVTGLIRDCLREMEYVDEVQHVLANQYIAMLEKVRSGIGLVGPALEANDASLALSIGELETQLERAYKRVFKNYVGQLGKGKQNTKDLVRGLFVAHTIRQMGEALLQISEAIISANIGQPMNRERYHSLQSLVSELETEKESIQVAPIAETRSGSAISGLSSSGDSYFAIFKEGLKRKVKEEREGVQSWHEIYPGLAPKILSYKKRGQSAALLIEHLPGFTFERILLNESEPLLDETLQQLGRTLRSVWQETQTEKSVQAGFMGQLDKRIIDVYKIHPEFESSKSSLCGVKLISFNDLVHRAARMEAQLPAPFSVYIHGDFNVDNIIYDPLERRIHFIDLHRSCYMDYVQDVSVFMVSNYRLQILDAPLRKRILKLALDFYQLVRRFARKMGDATFEIRLALGLARSFATSTRFILDKSLARSMYLRSRYLLEKVVATELDNAGRFKLPIKEIFND
ncbi:aminoglycoside phosphotransferase family protein [Ketobacter sp.]